MKTTTFVSLSPEAYIAVGKNRQKINGEKTVYLSDKQEFEFEFFNPTKDNIMAKISINGKYISNRGIILRPGVRGWLERYIDDSKKFLFETYVVDGNSAAVKKAIEDNGDVRIEFYREKQKPTLNAILVSASAPAYCSGNDSVSGSLSRGICDSMSLFDNEELECKPRSRGFSKSLSKTKSIETGRVEKGSTSGQQFTEIAMDFETFTFHTITYKLMPISQKPAEFNELKLKCTSCGTKIKSNWNLCPVCGKPIHDESKCSGCGMKVEPAWNFCPTCNNKLK